ncbi:MAG: alpha/beta fold hydrolase [Candidatus Velthaea sp.]|jgi:esterase/lipase
MNAPHIFTAGVAAIEALAAADGADAAIDPRCVPYVLHHGAATERAIVLFHGFTNCPRQFSALAQQFFERGFNVYVPRLPRHGLRDKLTTELAGLTADELIACANEAVALAAPLAASISVLGLSAGATLAAWLAQTQAVDRAVVIAPFFSVVRVPAGLEPVFAGALEFVPNLELWWDPRVKQNAEPKHAYPRFSTHALAQCLQLGETVRGLAKSAAPRAARSILVLNAKDPAIDNAAAQEVCELWRSHGAPTQTYTFENLDVRHDIIEPVTFPAAGELVYPILLQLVDQ